MKIKSPIALIASIVICELAGVAGSAFTIGSIPTWYAALAKPAFNPPGWLFGPVWTILYLLMGVAIYLVYESGIKNKWRGWAISAFAIQLALNALWSIVFFGAHSLLGGMAVIVALWIAIAATMALFLRVSR
ncbi:MAG: tryptophan-rich sensory protein, partial [Candidatus Micrarchaeota archaeon]|nr:tryptophan-rich sensory protein [Candidatus Micrarchaeota archaeon]